MKLEAQIAKWPNVMTQIAMSKGVSYCIWASHVWANFYGWTQLALWQ